MVHRSGKLKTKHSDLQRGAERSRVLKAMKVLRGFRGDLGPSKLAGTQAEPFSPNFF